MLLTDQLITFAAIAEHKTVHEAARKLFVTQTAVTQRLKNLEQNLGVTLFNRSRQGMALTTEGLTLMRYVNSLKSVETQALDDLNGFAIEREIDITITGPTSVLTSRTSFQTLEIRKNWNKLNLHLDLDDTNQRLNKLKNGQAQFAICSPASVPQEMSFKRLKSDFYVLVATSKWKKRRTKSILESEQIIDFYESDFTTLNYLKHFNLNDLKRARSRLFVNNNEVLMRFLCEGVGIGTLTTEVADPLIRAKKVSFLNSGKKMEDELALVWYPRAHPPKYFQAVIDGIN